MDVLKEYDEKMKPLRRIVGVAMEVYNEWGPLSKWQYWESPSQNDIYNRGLKFPQKISS